ncbi:MAG: hypothetical protein WC250_02325 [Candidatus Paceibacterota bacterium]|jgi:hypothetical protein
MKLMSFFAHLFAGIFGARPQESVIPVSRHQFAPSLPAAVKPTAPVVVIEAPKTASSGGMLAVEVETPLPVRLREARVTKWKHFEPAKAQFRSSSGQLLTAEIIEVAGTLVRLRRGHGGTFFRSLA